MEAKVSAIVLAAGMSRRMGVCKQLLPLGGRPAIVHCLEAVIGAGICKIVVVIGANGDRVAAAVSHLPVKLIRNHSIDGDMAASVRVGLEALSIESSGVLVSLADQPLITKETCKLLLQQHASRPEEIIIPVFEGHKGHPTIFPTRILSQIMAGGTLRDIIHNNPQHICLIQVNDPGVALDMDTPADYLMVKEHFTSKTD